MGNTGPKGADRKSQQGIKLGKHESRRTVKRKLGNHESQKAERQQVVGITSPKDDKSQQGREPKGTKGKHESQSRDQEENRGTRASKRIEPDVWETRVPKGKVRGTRAPLGAKAESKGNESEMA
jgi:hypothetical protein